MMNTIMYVNGPILITSTTVTLQNPFLVSFSVLLDTWYKTNQLIFAQLEFFSDKLSLYQGNWFRLIIFLNYVVALSSRNWSIWLKISNNISRFEKMSFFSINFFFWSYVGKELIDRSFQSYVKQSYLNGHLNQCLYLWSFHKRYKLMNATC